ncbi:MAG: ABC transporter permease [Gammaproteobacteria bacterium]
MSLSLLRLALTNLLRDWRSGELRLLALALTIATMCYTSVAFFTDRVNRATASRATELLAADLVVSSAAPIKQALIDQANAMGLITTRTINFRSMVVFADKLELAEVKAVQAAYPLYGRMRVSDGLLTPELSTRETPARGEVWPDARLFQLLNLERAAELRIGSSAFRVGNILTHEPDRGGDMFNIAPRLLMNLTDLQTTGLLAPGSRAQYKLLLAGDPTAIANFRALAEQDADLRAQGIREARPELRTALVRAEQFLGLAVLVSIALAGLTIAMSAQRYAGRHIDNCALMRCFGVGKRTIALLYFTQLLILAALFSLFGAALGLLGQHGLSGMMRLMSADTLPAPSLLPLLYGVLAGVITVLGFAAPQLMRLTGVPPLRVLRRQVTAAPVGTMLVYCTAIAALALLTPWQAGNMRVTLYSLAGLIVTAGILLLTARLSIRQLGKLRGRLGPVAKFSLAGISRRARVNTVQILGIGLGLTALTLLGLIRTDLLANWRDRLPDDAPNYFLINIQPEEVEQVQQFIMQRTGVAAKTAPMIRGRLLSINNQPANADDYTDPRAKRFVNRVFNLSIAVNLQEDNRLLAGDWWDETETGLFSFEQDFAETLRVGIGDELDFSIGGRTISGKIHNLRWVDWDTFNVNFFVVASPGTLDGLPTSHISSIHLDAGNKHLLLDLLRAYPHITVFDVDSLLTQIRNIMTQIIRAIEFVFIFTLLAGFVVLLAALQATHDERRYESALLNVLGAGRHYILGSSIIEFALTGLIAGLVAAITATGLELLLAEYVFRISIIPNLRTWIIVPLLSMLIVITGGLLGLRPVLSIPPAVAIRKIWL